MYVKGGAIILADSLRILGGILIIRGQRHKCQHRSVEQNLRDAIWSETIYKPLRETAFLPLLFRCKF